MTHKDMFEDSFPQDKQIGGLTTKTFTFSLTSLFQRIIFPSFKATL